MGSRRGRLAVTLLVLLLPVAVILARAVAAGSRAGGPAPPPAPPLAFDHAAAVTRLAEAVRIPTVSASPGPELDQAFAALHAHLRASFPRAHSVLAVETVAGHALLYTWPGLDARAAPLLLLGHTDVVPVERGTEERWRNPPFSGAVDAGFVWGRGTLDDKVTVLGVLEAVEALLAAGFRPHATVHLAFGGDEEVGGRQAAAMAALLARRGVRPRLVFDEGLVIGQGLVPGVARKVALLGTSEKGYATVELDVEVEGGHSSMPPRESAIGILARAVDRVERSPLAARLGDGPAGRLFEALAPEMAFGPRVALANLWLFAPLVRRQLEGSPASHALLRTTTAPTLFQAGVKDNVLPAQARASVNFRLLPGDSVEAVRAHVVAAVADPRVRVAVAPGASEPVAPREDPESYALVERTVREVFPDAVPAPSVMLGATDSRHYAGLGAPLYRFVPVVFGPEDLPRVHGSDERISVDAYAQAVRFYARLVGNAAGR